MFFFDKKTKPINTKIWVIVFLILAFSVSRFTFAAVGINKQINYQAKLTNTAGISVPNGNYDVVFKIYDAASAGTTLWTGTHTAANGNPITVTNGVFNVLLGSGTGNTLALDFSTDSYYLGVQIGTDAEMTPRKRLGATPQAFNANNLIGDGFIKLTGTPTGTGVDQGTVYINPSSATAGYTLLGLAVNGAQKFKVDEAGNVTQSGALTLGSKTADPSGVNGMSYYNSSTNKFRCYQNSAWTDCVGSGGVMAIGGSITSATAGSILFVGAAGIMQQDNANFFWDDVNNRLGIGGIISPMATIEVKSTTEQLRLGYDAAHYFSTTVNSFGNVSFDTNATNTGFVFADPIATSSFATIGAGTAGSAQLDVSSTTLPQLHLDYNSSNYLSIAVSSAGVATLDATSSFTFSDNVGIGDVSPASLFTVGNGDLFQINSSGDASFNGGGTLTLGAKTADPTGANGMSYYNSSTNKFRCHQNTAWTDCIGAGGSMSIGDSITSATAGSVLFAGTAGIMQQDNANFFWDDVNDRLGIGDATPVALLTVGDGDLFRVSSTGVVTTTVDLNVTQAIGQTVNILGTKPVAVATTPATAAAEIMDITAPYGGDTTIATTGVGGIGSGISWVMGGGGVASAADTSSTGGSGGGISLTSGVGGLANAAGIDIGGAGGALTLTGGAGGAATLGTTLTGGAGGAVTISAGAAGVGGNANGGTLTLRSGARTGTGTSLMYIGTTNATAITLGSATSTVAIGSSAWDITAAGAISGITTLGMSGQLTSTLAAGTAPFAVTSTTLNNNLNADMLDGYDGAMVSTVSTYALRDGSGDISTRLFRSEYDGTNPTIGYIMTQVNTTTDNYLRPSTPAQLITGLGLGSGGTNDIWVNEAGDTMTGRLTSTLATGTSPFAVTSTTVNTNLNADLWDGQQFASYLNQAVLSTSAPTFATINTGQGANELYDMNQHVLTTSAVTFASMRGLGSGSLVLQSTSTVTNDPGDLVFANDAGTQLGRMWADSAGTVRVSAGSGVATGAQLISGNSSWTSFSDVRLKENIQTIDGALAKVLNMRGVYYNMIVNSANQREIGVIAQEVKPYFPELVENLDGGYLGVTYDRIAPILIEAVKEQQTQITGITNNQTSITTDLDSLTLKTDQNITSLAGLQASIDDQLGIIDARFKALEEGEISQISRIDTLETLTTTLQSQLDSLETLLNPEITLAKIDQLDTDISYLKTLLNINPDKPNDISILGKFTAENLETGLLTIKVVDSAQATIGTAVICPVGKKADASNQCTVDDAMNVDGKSVVVPTTAVSADSKIFVTVKKADEAVPTKVGVIVVGESFAIEISKALTGPTELDWWIVEAK